MGMGMGWDGRDGIGMGWDGMGQGWGWDGVLCVMGVEVTGGDV